MSFTPPQSYYSYVLLRKVITPHLRKQPSLLLRKVIIVILSTLYLIDRIVILISPALYDSVGAEP